MTTAVEFLATFKSLMNRQCREDTPRRTLLFLENTVMSVITELAAACEKLTANQAALHTQNSQLETENNTLKQQIADLEAEAQKALDQVNAELSAEHADAPPAPVNAAVNSALGEVSVAPTP